VSIPDSATSAAAPIVTPSQSMKVKGKSTLKAFACPCGQNIWAGRPEVHAACTKCGGVFEARKK
jgi:hypothetical protein